jgi:hypothetical protein
MCGYCPFVYLPIILKLIQLIKSIEKVGDISKIYIYILEMCISLLVIIITVWILNCEYDGDLVVDVVATIEESMVQSHP